MILPPTIQDLNHHACIRFDRKLRHLTAYSQRLVGSSRRVLRSYISSSHYGGSRRLCWWTMSHDCREAWRNSLDTGPEVNKNVFLFYKRKRLNFLPCTQTWRVSAPQTAGHDQCSHREKGNSAYAGNLPHRISAQHRWIVREDHRIQQLACQDEGT